MRKPSLSKKQTLTGPPAPRIAHIDFYVNKETAFLRYVNYLSNPLHIAWRNFLAGTFHGVGFILGSAILLTIVGSLLNWMTGEIPFFTDFNQALNIWFEETLENTR